MNSLTARKAEIATFRALFATPGVIQIPRLILPNELTFVTYNAHLFGRALEATPFGPRIGAFDDDHRALALVAALSNRQALPEPDIVGLTEVWDLRLQRLITEGVRNLYPYSVSDADFLQGMVRPGLAGLLRSFWPVGEPLPILGSGLVLLSRHKWLATPRFIRLPGETQWSSRMRNIDTLSAKGMISCVIAPDPDVSLGVVLVHTQADYASRKYRETRWRQLEVVTDELLRLCSVAQVCALVCFGDLNVVAGSEEWLQALQLTGLEDPFPTGISTQSGQVAHEFTYDGALNPLVRRFAPRNASVRERLDYILVRACGPNVGISVERAYIDPKHFLTPSGLPLSDHYPLFTSVRLQAG